MMVTNMKDYVTLDCDNVDADFRYSYRDTMIAQLKQDLCNKNFSFQGLSKGDQIDTLLNRIKFWLNNIDDTGVQYLMIYIILIITTKDWIILFSVQRYFLRLENLKNYWI